MYHVNLVHWNPDNGYTHSETIDNFEKYMPAIAWLNSLDDDLIDFIGMVEIRNEDGDLIDNYFHNGELI